MTARILQVMHAIDAVNEVSIILYGTTGIPKN